MSKPFVLILTHHTDPGHGWVEVPEQLVVSLGIEEKISEYSYYSFDKKAYYLEEDCDAELLVNALKANGYEYVIRHQDHRGDAFIRRMARVGAV